MSDPTDETHASTTLPLPGWAARNERRKFLASILWGFGAAIAAFGLIRPSFENGLRFPPLVGGGVALVMVGALCVWAYILLGDMEDK